MPAPKIMPELAQRVGCEQYPARWDALFPGFMAEYDRSGCKYADPAYYAELDSKYGILGKELALYQESAVAIGKDDDLSRFLYVLCRALEDRQYHKEDVKCFTAPKRKGDLAYDMLTGLAVASEAPMCHAVLTARGLPQTVIDEVMRMPEFGVQFYRLRNNGQPGYSLLDWYQLAIDGKIFRVGRLEFEIFHDFHGRACIFENSDGKRVALAHDIALHASGIALGSAGFEDEDGFWTAQVTETIDRWIGYPVRDDGSVESSTIELPKDQWRLVLKKGDPTVSVHIPAGGGLTPEIVDKSIEMSKEFISRYFPDYSYKAFVCYSWLMDPQLNTLVGEESNISKFNRRFAKLPAKSGGSGVLSFVFHRSSKDLDLHSLPETSRLERALKQHYLNGKYIYELTGYFF